MQNISLVPVEYLVGREKGHLLCCGNDFYNIFVHCVVKNDGGFLCVQQMHSNVKLQEGT